MVYTPISLAMNKCLNLVLFSIKDIAESPLPTVQSAIQDDKAAKLLQSACKAAVKRGDTGGTAGKRPASVSSLPPAKRARGDGSNEFMKGSTEMSPQELEHSLELPLCIDEERIAKTVLRTNRAPLVLAFAVEILRYTMPEQPLSSRLSLGQAVVSANSRSKAVSLGLDKGPSADAEGWGEGQPRVRVLGREVAVLKRGGYEWRGEETVDEKKAETQTETQNTQSTSTTATIEAVPSKNPWAASQPVSLKSSTFIARATHISDPNQRKQLIQSLLNANPNLKTATHNAWAYRINSSGRIREESFDDGESGCGDLMLRVMRDASAVDTLVVLTRWWGGIMLGPDRWRLMRNCVNGALSERLRRGGHEVTLGGEAVWGLDLEAARSKGTVVGGYGSGTKQYQSTGVVGMQTHRPESARAYLLKSFPTAPTEGDEQSSKKKTTLKAIEAEKAENLGLLLGALRIVLESWADYLTPSELDKRAWSWYIAVRPDVDSGPSGWGAKGTLKLSEILKLKRNE